MDNYAELLERAKNVHDMAQQTMSNRMYHSSSFLFAAAVVEELTEALVTVGTQNRNLRSDLALAKRDYEANLEELLRAGDLIEHMKGDRIATRALFDLLREHPGAVHEDPETANRFWVESEGVRHVFDEGLENTYVGEYDPMLEEELE